MIRAAYSEGNKSAILAAESLRDQLENPALVFFFASSQFEPEAIARAVHEVFPAARTIGCTTAGEMVTGRVLVHSLVALGLDPEDVSDVQFGIVEALSEGSVARKVQATLGDMARSLGEPAALWSRTKFAGVVLTDGLSLAEEQVMDAISDATTLAFVGGSAGDDLSFERTVLFCDGQVYEDASVLAVFRPRVPFEVIKTQSFSALGPTLTATRVHEESRTVLEFDGIPAARAYAEALGCIVEDLPNLFQRHPLGLMADGGEPFVRSPRQLQADSIVFFCAMKEGTTYHLLQAGDIVEDTRRDLGHRLEACLGMVNFHCILRTLQLQDSHQTEDYGALFSKIPMVGFSTYGESYIGHINQTSTLLVFG